MTTQLGHTSNRKQIGSNFLRQPHWNTDGATMFSQSHLTDTGDLENVCTQLILTRETRHKIRPEVSYRNTDNS